MDDYETKYRKLKDYILQSESDRSVDSMVMERLSNLVFVYNDHVLGPDATAVVLSMIVDFIRLADVRDNIELSKYYSPGSGLIDKNSNVICEDCEIVLRYTDSTVCWSEGKIVKEGTADCHLSRGLLRLYLKLHSGEQTYKYEKIHTVNVTSKPQLDQYSNKPYQDIGEMENIGNANRIANVNTQTEILQNLAMSGGLDTSSVSQASKSLYAINDISNKAKQGSVEAQLPLSTYNRVTSSAPSQASVNSANTVARSLMQSPKSHNLSALLVPGNENMPLYRSNTTSQVMGRLSDRGITIQSGAGNNTINSKIASRRVSLLVDSNLAVVPTKTAAEQVSIKENADVTMNKLNEYWKQFVDSMKDTVGKAKESIDQFTKSIQKTTVTPVSKDLSVVSSTPKSVPIPKTFSHQIGSATTVSLENRLAQLGKQAGDTLQLPDWQKVHSNLQQLDKTAGNTLQLPDVDKIKGNLQNLGKTASETLQLGGAVEDTLQLPDWQKVKTNLNEEGKKAEGTLQLPDWQKVKANLQDLGKSASKTLGFGEPNLDKLSESLNMNF